MSAFDSSDNMTDMGSGGKKAHGKHHKRGPMHMKTHKGDTGAHPSHDTMNKAHGTPGGFGPSEGYGAGAEPTHDEYDDHDEDMC